MSDLKPIFKPIVGPQGGSGTAPPKENPLPPSDVTFARGAVVQLKSGSAKMTVEKIAGESIRNPDRYAGPVRENEVGCVWFDEAGKLNRDKFPVAALTAV